MTKYLAIDYGDKKLGLALGDSELKVATPFKILKNTAELYKKLNLIVNEEEIDEIILGYPRYMDGQKTSYTEIIDNIKGKLEDKLDLPVHLYDERLTSVAAENLVKGKHSSQAEHDDVAAMLILQGYLDSLSS